MNNQKTKPGKTQMDGGSVNDSDLLVLIMALEDKT